MLNGLFVLGSFVSGIFFTLTFVAGLVLVVFSSRVIFDALFEGAGVLSLGPPFFVHFMGWAFVLCSVLAFKRIKDESRKELEELRWWVFGQPLLAEPLTLPVQIKSQSFAPVVSYGLGLAFIAFGLHLLSDGYWLWLPSVALGSFFLIGQFVMRGSWNDPLLALSQHGFQFRTLQEIAWGSVLELRMTRAVHRGWIFWRLSLTVEGASRVFSDVGPFVLFAWRVFAGARKRANDTFILTLTVSNLDRSPEAIWSTIKEVRNRTVPPVLEGWESALSDKQVEQARRSKTPGGTSPVPLRDEDLERVFEELGADVMNPESSGYVKPFLLGATSALVIAAFAIARMWE